MHASIILGSLASLAMALPLESRDDAQTFTITGLRGTFPYPYGPYGAPNVDSSVTITVTYPDPASSTGATLTTTCSTGWPSGVDPAPTAWTACADTTVQFRLPEDGWVRYTDFNVQFFQTVGSDGSGLEASHRLTAGPANGSDPDAYMFCIQMGKFNPLTCSLTGPYGGSPRTVTMPAIEVATRPA